MGNSQYAGKIIRHFISIRAVNGMLDLKIHESEPERQLNWQPPPHIHIPPTHRNKVDEHPPPIRYSVLDLLILSVPFGMLPYYMLID